MCLVGLYPISKNNPHILLNLVDNSKNKFKNKIKIKFKNKVKNGHI